MTASRSLRVRLALVFIGAIAPRVSAAQPSALPSDLVGAWRVSTAVLAPWVKSDSASVNRTKYLTKIVQIRPTSFTGLAPFACTDARYEPTRMPPEGLFQGGLPTPADKAARAVGFAAGTVRGISLNCATGIFEFHAADTAHLLVAIDNVIWTLDRSPGALASATSPEGIVQALLERHFAGGLGFDRAAVQRFTPYLTPALLASINAYLARPTSPNEVPKISGDPFTDSQEYPTRFSVQRATITNTSATLLVRFADGWSSKSLRYRLRRGTAGWGVDDIAYNGGQTFVNLLR